MTVNHLPFSILFGVDLGGLFADTTGGSLFRPMFADVIGQHGHITRGKLCFRLHHLEKLILLILCSRGEFAYQPISSSEPIRFARVKVRYMLIEYLGEKLRVITYRRFLESRCSLQYFTRGIGVCIHNAKSRQTEKAQNGHQ